MNCNQKIEIAMGLALIFNANEIEDFAVETQEDGEDKIVLFYESGLDNPVTMMQDIVERVRTMNVFNVGYTEDQIKNFILFKPMKDL